MLITLFILCTVLWMISLWYAFQFLTLGKISKRQSKDAPPSTLPPISIIVTCHDQLTSLQQNLPLLLEQEYPSDFEVIVVDMKSSDNTLKWLDYIKDEYPHLHCSVCPASARDISLQRLALTLGVRSAQHEWVLFMQPDVSVPNLNWLCQMTAACTDSVDAVQGFVRYATQYNRNERAQQFLRLWQQMLWMPFAQNHAPYRADGACLCYRKSIFMQHHGFASSATLLEGAETLLVNHNIKRGRCAINVSPQVVATQPQPSRQQWEVEQTFFMETRRHKKHTALYRLFHANAVISHWLYPLSAIATIGACLTIHFDIGPFQTADVSPSLLWWMVALTATQWTSLHIFRQIFYHITSKQLGIASVHLSLPLFLNLIPVWDTKAWLRWRFTDRRTFRKKFV